MVLTPYFGPDPVSWRWTFASIWRAAWCAAAVCRRRAVVRRRRRGHRRGGGSRRRPPRARESVTAIATTRRRPLRPSAGHRRWTRRPRAGPGSPSAPAAPRVFAGRQHLPLFRRRSCRARLRI